MADLSNVDLQAIAAMMPFAQSSGVVVNSATPGEVVGYWIGHPNAAPRQGYCTEVRS